MKRLAPIFFILILSCSGSFFPQESSSQDYQNRWIEVFPGYYIGPQGIGIPGALRSFGQELRPKIWDYAKDEVALKLTEALVKGVSAGCASFISFVGYGKTAGELTADWMSSMEKDMGRAGVLETISAITGYQFASEGRIAGMRVLKIPGFNEMALEHRAEIAGALLQMYKQAVVDYNSNYGYLDKGLYMGKLQQWENMTNLWKDRNEVARVKEKIDYFAKPVPSYWTFREPDRPQSKTMIEAKIMTEMVGDKSKALIVGKGPEANLMYRQMCEKMGAGNVKQIYSYMNNRELQLEARRFGAGVILGVKGDFKRGESTTLNEPERRYKDWRKEVPGMNRNLPEGAFTSGGNDIGGVMLQGAAEITGSTGDEPRLTGGTFSLIFRNGDSEVDIGKLCKFVTALWAVYFSKEGPGISIDPIAPGIDKHLVRYIGKVVNSDLGRVMRETDYMMKKWAVGTEKPGIDGFRSVDDLSARHGIRYLGASRRFWFVPENMRFSLLGNALLFESGRMTLKTEYVFLNKGVRAEPADEAFARVFTDHYEEIARKYPVYEELFEYARYVSLARYLKEKGIPLFWFLLANKDMVITEDSPGTVDALAKKSDHFEYITIAGGVDLSGRDAAARYVMDREAAAAILEAVRRYGVDSIGGTTVLPKRNIIIEPGSQKLTLVPALSLSLSAGGSGDIKFQTDLAFRLGDEPGLELVRYFSEKVEGIPIFGKDWHLFIPYRVRPAGEQKVDFLNARIPGKMMVKNLITGRQEILTFSKERYNIAGYVPDSVETGNIIGLFLLSDASFRLADKLGNEFQFDQAGRLTEMIFSDKHHLRFEYGFEEVFAKDVAVMSCRIEPAGKEVEQYSNILLPRKMRLVNQAEGSEEVLALAKDNPYNIVGYIPVNHGRSRYSILALMSDGSFVLGDEDGGEIAFDPTGRPERVKTVVVKGFSQGDFTINFAYEFKHERFRVKEARLVKKASPKPLYTVMYRYDEKGRLNQVLPPAY